MLPAKYQPNPPGGSGEEDFLMVFTIYGHGGHLEFRFPQSLDATYELWLHLAQWFQRRSRLKVWTDDGRTTEACHPLSSPGAFGSGEVKMYCAEDLHVG